MVARMRNSGNLERRMRKGQEALGPRPIWGQQTLSQKGVGHHIGLELSSGSAFAWHKQGGIQCSTQRKALKGKESRKIWNARNLATCLTLSSVAVTEYHRLNHKACLVSCSSSREVQDGAATSLEALPALVDSPQSPRPFRASQGKTE